MSFLVSVKKIGRTNKKGIIFRVISSPQTVSSVQISPIMWAKKNKIEANANLLSKILFNLLEYPPEHNHNITTSQIAILLPETVRGSTDKRDLRNWHN